MTQILPLGDCAFLINFEQKIAPQIHSRVTRLVKQIEQASLPGIDFYIPAYCSVTVGFDPTILQAEELTHLLETWLEAEAHSERYISARQLTIPVCYEENYAPDLEELAAVKGMSKQDIIQLHTRTSYTVYMLGFIPGFAYMGILPEVLHCPRKSKPRLRVPAGSVGLAAFQTGIYPSEAPGGWQLIGRTPIHVFDAHRRQPNLFQHADQVQFQAISSEEFAQIESLILNKQFDYASLYE